MATMQYFDPFPQNRGDELGNMASYRKHPHRGSDWGAKKGIENKPVKAITNGRVKAVFWSDVLGNCLIQSTGDGFHLLYAHLAKPSESKVGDLLVGGTTVVGLVGGGKNTPSGSASTGAHLHAALAKDPKPHLCAYEKLVDLHKWIDSNNRPVQKLVANPEGQ